MTMTETSSTTGTPDTAAGQADALRANYNATVQAWTESGTYTDTALAEMVANLRNDTNAKLDALAAADAQVEVTERTALERDVFAPPALPFGASPSDRIVRDASYRDARDRARATEAHPTRDDDGLLAMLTDAELIGDAVQAKACLAVAMERGDVATLNAYTAAHPEAEAAVDRLYALRSAPKISDLRTTVARAFTFGRV